MEIKLTEAMTLPLPDDGGILGSDALDPILEKLSASHVGVIGCGMGKTRQTIQLVADIIRHSETPMVIDADALNALSENVQVLAEAQADIVLTPHFMEMSRLTGLALEKIEKNPIETAREFAKKYKTTLVLKGPNTVISEPDGTVFVNPTGNNGMACGGSGDVLSGIIGGLMAQGMKGCEAAVLGVYLHGMAGDSARDCLGEYSMLPTDVINHIGKAISKIYIA